MSTFRGLLSRISRPSQVIVPWYRRFTLIPHVVISTAMAWGAAFDQGSFTSPVFDSIFDWANIWIWAVGYSIAGIFAVVTILNNSWKTYFLANILTLGLSLLWATALTEARFAYGIAVSTPAFGLWGFVVSTCVVLAAIPIRVIRTR